MRQTTIPVLKQHIPESTETAIGDLRFRNLLSAADWAQLPPAIRMRFSKRLTGGATAIYVGIIDRAVISNLGRILAFVLRLIGAPLPLRAETGTAAVVSVTEEESTGGQIWSRLYASTTAFPQVIQSSKRFVGSTGLEEYIGYGIAMALSARVTPTALVFESAGYFLRLGRHRLPLPRFLSPGNVTVTHEEITPEHFRFTLRLQHSHFGVLIEQSGVFAENRAP